MDTDMMIMAQPDFMAALIVHVAGALTLFAAFGLQAAIVTLLRRAETVDHTTLIVQIGRKLPIAFGIGTAAILASGLYMGYLDWHGGEEIGWIVAALLLFVVLAAIGSLTGQRLAATLSATLAASGGVMTDSLRRELSRTWPSAWLRISVCAILGILIIMVIQPDTFIAVSILLAAILAGLLLASRQLVAHH